MKRFTETDKWHDPWFRKLQGIHKLVFIFLIENCNNAGFYEFDADHVAYSTGLKLEHVNGALMGLERAIKGASGWVWVKNFLRHQKNENLNPENPAHRQIIGLIRVHLERFAHIPEFNEFIAPFKGLYSPIGTGTGLVQDSGKRSGEGKTKRNRKPPVTEIPESLNTPEFTQHWDAWSRHRKEKGKTLTDTTIELQLKDLAGMGISRAIAALHLSTRNGWDGIHEGKSNGSNGHSMTTVPPHQQNLPPEAFKTPMEMMAERKAREAEGEE